MCELLEVGMGRNQGRSRMFERIPIEQKDLLGGRSENWNHCGELPQRRHPVEGALQSTEEVLGQRGTQAILVS